MSEQFGKPTPEIKELQEKIEKYCQEHPVSSIPMYKHLADTSFKLAIKGYEHDYIIQKLKEDFSFLEMK